MGNKNGRRTAVDKDDYRGFTRKSRRAHTKCRKHASCRNSTNSVWNKA